ncbi:hypothetical protein [Miniphocaeibacter halophilus]|uniref:Uncharacterized protein n=1 Tax=Miniphocaeibacter halophilus TaxID=2931922 RepID=A0AC61MX77_9FIRM|nr:hypothetical protein [Miniphocaeibacter halophilus]QQK08296.1 hypothetical protein JFY71_01780 [Miniphocaeibacter halophilus]
MKKIFCKNKLKKLSILLAILLICFVSVSCSNGSLKNKPVDKEIIELLDRGFKDPIKLDVKDERGNDVKEEFLEKTEEYYENGEYRKILNIIDEENLNMSVPGN